MARHRYGFFDIVIALVVLRAAFFAYFVISGGEALGGDSLNYLLLSDNLANVGWFSRSTEVFSPEVFRTPGYPVFLSLFSLLGLESQYWVSLTQEILYLATAFLFYQGIRRLMDEDIARVTLVFLLVEPGGLAYPKLVLSETLFVPFIIGAILLLGFYFRDRSWPQALMAGLLLGLATMVRPAAMYLPLLFGVVMWLGAPRRPRAALHVGVMAVAFIAVLSPWLLRNYIHFGALHVSGQTSRMLANYHVPMVWESVKELPFEKGQETMKSRVADAAAAESARRDRPLDTVEVYRLQQSMALEELARHPFDYAEQWFYGVLKSSMGSNLTEIYRVTGIRADRVHNFDIVEPSFFRKVVQYLIHQDPFVLVEVIFRGLLALFVLVGAWAILRCNQPFLWIMLLANLYFVFIPGPMGNSRFRFPVEGFWFIQAWLGLGFVGTRLALPGLRRIRWRART